MIISRFIEPELEFFRRQCNFVGAERDLFELRSRGVPIEEIAERMNLTVDGANKISRKVNDKISRGIEYGGIIK